MKMSKSVKLFAMLFAAVFSMSSCKGKESAGSKPDFSKPNPESDFEFSLVRNGTAIRIDYYSGKSKNVVVPSEIQGCPVVNFSPDEWPEIENLVISEGVEVVNVRSEILKYIKLPSSLKFISLHSNVLESVDIPEGVLFVDFGRTPLKSVKLPKSLVGIADRAFEKSNLKSITMPEGLKYLGNMAFEDCDKLEEINVPEGFNPFFVCTDSSWFGIHSEKTFEDVFTGEKIKKTVALQKLLKHEFRDYESSDNAEFKKFYYSFWAD
ncbi:leucine-rich repeat domain-containing protein [Treponema sp.]|uniref:leucine-rich repeat domain-containing protein n=1 Tax=Treponema sp. TaxID=166 RepID=UPI0025F0FEE1|nr:leucine-rich repeat domain-containing protein [Treponema sp.]MCR5219327.1 leucine-rich repeat domain-containing protein [Treponema sp.]